MACLMTAIFHDPDNIAHCQAGHPERPERYTAVVEALERTDLLERLTPSPGRPATGEELGRVHEPGVLERIAHITTQGGGWLDPDTYCTQQSGGLARQAAGGICELSLAVARGEHANGLALPRPCGHHATATGSMGFCLFNHVAVAARALQSAGLARKVAILDFDVHHGNGTQDIFAEDPTVFFASSHQFPHYPGTGRAAERGGGPGEGFTLNVPLAAGAGDAEFLGAWRESILPATAAFAPDFLLVSAGYDAHRLDPLAGLEVSTPAFSKLVQDILDLARTTCRGKVVFVLEGGYHLEALAQCVCDTTRLLLRAAEGESA